MKPGFGSKKHKNRKKKADKKNATEGAAVDAHDGDDAMMDTRDGGATAGPAPATVGTDSASPDAQDAGAGAEASAKDKQRRRMALKTSLKVKVSLLKQQRWV